jgi:hypothetical protein
VLPTFPDNNETFAGYLVGITNFAINVGNPRAETCAEGNVVISYFTRAAKYVDWIADVMGVDSSELLATSSGDPVSSATSILLNRFDSMSPLIMLCSLVLAIIVVND